MIRTIGSLVQETSTRRHYYIATSLYTLACLITSSLLGMFLSSTGMFLNHNVSSDANWTIVSTSGYILVGTLSIAYAFSDAGLVRLPRPTIMQAVPVTWWRWWRPYGAAIAYGAALGLGLTTRIEFGAFYILCLWCILKGNVLYGAVLMGIYGITRALVLLPTSWGAYRYCKDSERYFAGLLAQLSNAKIIVAVALIIFGTSIIISAIM